MLIGLFLYLFKQLNMESKKEDSQDLSLQNMEDFEYAKQVSQII